LGGGTGSGVIPVLAPKLRETFIGTPVIAIGVLPAPSEGELASFNAARSLMALAGNVDGFIMVDNEKFLRWGKSMHESYRIINHRLVRRLRLIAEASEGPVAGEKVLDAADILNTICGTARIAAQVGEDVMSGGGRAGGPLAAELSTVGYASEQLPRWPIVGLRRKTNPMWRARRILALTKTALTEALIDANFENATQSLILVVGPQDEIDMEGFVAARSWLSKLSNGGEVRGGDYPVKSKTLEVIVAFGGLTEIPRVTQILEMGKDFTAKRPEVVKDKQERLSQLYSASADIEPLG
jgi:cell division GTPase FtsZ